MKQFFYSVPIDMKILTVIYMVTALICQIYPHNTILVDLCMLYSVCFIGYCMVNIKLSNRNERHCKYLLYWNIWGNKNNIFISMHKENVWQMKVTKHQEKQRKRNLKMN